MAGDSQEQFDSGLNFKDLLFLFWSRKWLILNIVVLGLVAGSVYAYRLPNEFTASAQILLEPTHPGVKRQQTQDVAIKELSSQQFAVYVNLIRSSEVLARVGEDLGLQKKWARGSGSALIPLTSEEVVGRLKGIVNVQYDEFIYTVTTRYSDPFLTAAIANSVMKNFIKKYFRDRMYLSKEMKDLFPEEAKSLEKFTTPGKLENLNRKELIEKLPTVMADATVKKLEQKKYQLEGELSQYSSRYKDKHPKMIELRRNLKFVDERLVARREEIADRLKEKLVNQFQDENLRVLEEAKIPRVPSGPDRQRIILIACLGALGLACGLVYLLDLLDETVNNHDDVERFIQIPFMAPIYAIKKEKNEDRRALYVMHEPLSETGEAFKSLRVNMNFSTATEHRETLMVTSTLPQEGKSFVSTNIAISKAQDGKKVLLVDADLRRPRIHRAFKLENKKGLSNILATQLDWQSVISKTEVENLDVITSGPVSPNPPEIFNSQAMKDFLKNLKGKYETVIFDAPPAYNLPDPLVLGNLIDSTLYVIRAHKVSHKLISKTTKHLLNHGVRIVGVVLNCLDIVRDRSYVSSYKSYGYNYTRKKTEIE